MAPITAPTTRLEAILGRPERPLDVGDALDALSAHRVLLTGSLGSIGGALLPVLATAGVLELGTDIPALDVRKRSECRRVMDSFRPTLIFHLAASKYAPWAEEHPAHAADTNVLGTANVLEAASEVGARVITASTCKAVRPETVYGASKLIAERMTLEAGGSVVRFFNVVETAGNVFETWRALPEPEPLPVTPCSRYFISLREAQSLFLAASVLAPGRYTLDPGASRPMIDVAQAAYPGRATTKMVSRRGDRLREPLLALDERVMPMREHLWRVVSAHDREPAW